MTCCRSVNMALFKLKFTEVSFVDEEPSNGVFVSVKGCLHQQLITLQIQLTVKITSWSFPAACHDVTTRSAVSFDGCSGSHCSLRQIFLQLRSQRTFSSSSINDTSTFSFQKRRHGPSLFVPSSPLSFGSVPCSPSRLLPSCRAATTTTKTHQSTVCSRHTEILAISSHKHRS